MRGRIYVPRNKNNVADCDKLHIKMFSTANDARTAKIYMRCYETALGEKIYIA